MLTVKNKCFHNHNFTLNNRTYDPFKLVFGLISKNNNTRLWGACSTSCMDQSQIHSIDLIATHFAFLTTRHWVVSCNVSCPYHGSQVWTIEKFFDPGHDFRNHGSQTLEDGTIYFSCSSYLNHRAVKKSHYFSSYVSMGTAASSITGTRGYDFFIRNCKWFGRGTFKDIKRLDNGRGSYGGGDYQYY